MTSWLGFTLMLGELGPGRSRLCFYVAPDPRRADSYVATARAMTLAGGTIAMVCGLALAPALGHGHPGLTTAYRITFLCLPVSCIADSYTFALMGRALPLWNQARLSQSAVALAAVIALWKLADAHPRRRASGAARLAWRPGLAGPDWGLPGRIRGWRPGGWRAS